MFLLAGIDILTCRDGPGNSLLRDWSQYAHGQSVIVKDTVELIEGCAPSHCHLVQLAIDTDQPLFIVCVCVCVFEGIQEVPFVWEKLCQLFMLLAQTERSLKLIVCVRVYSLLYQKSHNKPGLLE